MTSRSSSKTKKSGLYMAICSILWCYTRSGYPIGTFWYNLLILFNGVVNAVLVKVGKERTSLAKPVKSSVKLAIIYLNSGDWVENLSALEYDDGEWSIFRYDQLRSRWVTSGAFKASGLLGADTHVRAHTKLNGVLEVELLLSNRLSAIPSLALAGKLADDSVLAYGRQQLIVFRRLSGIAAQ